MAEKLRAGNYGYGHAKKELLAFILDSYCAERKDYDRWMSNPDELNNVLTKGADRAREKASKMISRVRSKVGL